MVAVGQPVRIWDLNVGDLDGKFLHGKQIWRKKNITVVQSNLYMTGTCGN